MKVQCCLITSTKPSAVTKEYCLVDGKLQKSTSASIAEGRMEVIDLASAKEFADLLTSLDVNQCLTYGIPPHDAGLVTENVWQGLGQPDDPLPRTQSVFSWPRGAGVLMLDYDAPKTGHELMSKKKLLTALMLACPDVQDADLIWWLSTSSHIYAGDENLTGLKGQRIYLFVEDASDIPRAASVLNDRLWSMGYGHFEVSMSGSLLKRSLFDLSVWQTNHIDFAAGACCGPGLVQKRGVPFVIGGESFSLLDTKMAIPDLTEEEVQKMQDHQRKCTAAVEVEAVAKRKDWITARTSVMAQFKPSTTQEQAAMVVRRAVESQDLSGDWPLTVRTKDGKATQVTVAEALDTPSQFHGLLTLDPLEPEYDGGRFVGKLFLNGPKPNLHSFAHGGTTFRLHRQPARIELVTGRSVDSTDQLLDVLRAAPDVFDFGEELVRVGHEGSLLSQNDKSLRYVAGGLVQFWTRKKVPNVGEVEVLRDPPGQICQSVIALGAQRRLKPLLAVITAPTLRTDGSLLDKPGYDQTTGLLFDPHDEVPRVPFAPTYEQAKAALHELWKPFEDFPFCSPLDRAVHLAALLTAAVRSSLPAAPGFAYDAPVQGSGKTLLARCVGVLVQGTDPGVWPHTAGRDDEEIRKRIFSVLRSGSRLLIWDNVVGTFDSASMASCMTSPTFTDRILGQSTSNTVPNRMMLVLTGNNLQLQGEMPRRVLVCRIDPATDKPFAREFSLDPYAYCRENRQRMIAAALTLIRAYLTHGIKVHTAGRLASFEDWDLWVRRTVLYAEQLSPGKFADVMDSIKANQIFDPEQEALGNFLKSWDDVFSNRPICVADLLQRAEGFNVEDRILRDALENMTALNFNQLKPRTIGKYLGYRKGRIANNRLLELGPKVNDRQTWRVRHANLT